MPSDYQYGAKAGCATLGDNNCLHCPGLARSGPCEGCMGGAPTMAAAYASALKSIQPSDAECTMKLCDAKSAVGCAGKNIGGVCHRGSLTAQGNFVANPSSLFIPQSTNTYTFTSSGPKFGVAMGGCDVQGVQAGINYSSAFFNSCAGQKPPTKYGLGDQFQYVPHLSGPKHPASQCLGGANYTPATSGFVPGDKLSYGYGYQ